MRAEPPARRSPNPRPFSRTNTAAVTMKHPLRFLSLAALLLCLLAPAARAQNAWINEFHYDNAGTDTGEFVEVVIEDAGTYDDLSAFSIVLYNGNDSTEYDTKTLAEFDVGDTANGFTFYTHTYPSNGIQNGDDGSFADVPDGIALCYNGEVVGEQFLSYEGTFTAADECAEGVTSTDVGIRETGDEPAGSSLQLEGTAVQYAGFTWSGPAPESPGSVNDGQTLAVAPVAVRLRFDPTSVPESVPVGETFSVTVQAVDNEGAVGVNEASQVVLRRSVGQGSLTSASQGAEIVGTLSNGTVTFDGLAYDTPEEFTIEAQSLVLAGATSARIEATGEVEEVTAGATLDGPAGWRLLSPPFAGLDVAFLHDTYYVQGVEGASPGADVSIYLDYQGPEGATASEFWVPARALGDPLSRGEGFLWYVFEEDTSIVLSATRAPSTGPQVVFVKTDHVWYPLGNPFDVPYDLTGLILGEQTGFMNTVQIWDPEIEGYQLVTRNEAVRTEDSDHIAVWQGFFVQRAATGEGLGELTFRTAGRVPGGEAPFYGLHAEGEAPPATRTLGLRLRGRDVYDAAARLFFHPEAKPGWDWWDASKLAPLSTPYAALAFRGTRADGGEVLKAQEGLPYELRRPVEVPVVFTATPDAGAQFVLSAPQSTWQNIPDTWQVTLLDRVTGTEVDLRAQPRYAFTAGEAARAAPALHAAPGPTAAVARPLALSEAARQEAPRFTLRIDPRGRVPAAFVLRGNAPNPFAGSTTIRYDLPEDAHVRITVYDALGRRVATLVDEEQRAGADKAVRFGAEGLPSGVYFYRIEAGTTVRTRKMVHVR